MLGRCVIVSMSDVIIPPALDSVIIMPGLMPRHSLAPTQSQCSNCDRDMSRDTRDTCHGPRDTQCYCYTHYNRDHLYSHH